MRKIEEVIADEFAELDISQDAEYQRLYNDILKYEKPVIDKVGDIKLMNDLEVANDLLNGYRIECAIRFTLDFVKQLLGIKNKDD